MTSDEAERSDESDRSGELVRSDEGDRSGELVRATPRGSSALTRAVERLRADWREPDAADAGACPGDALVGRWELRTLVMWDYYLRRRRVRGHYTLEVEPRAGAGCVLDAQLTKTGSSNRSYSQPPVGSAQLELDAQGRLSGDWNLFDGKQHQHLRMSFAVEDERLRGHYFRYATSPDGIERRSLIGPAYGARAGYSLPEIDELEQIPCRDQCSLLCGGEQATQRCAARCVSDEHAIVECGPPSEDFLAPYTTQRNLERFARGEWRPAVSGRACEVMPELLEGPWTVNERLDTGDTRRWHLELELEGCRLHGRALAFPAHHWLEGELDAEGRWLLRDTRDPSALQWSLQGWSFAFGHAGGDRPGRLSAYKHRSN